MILHDLAKRMQPWWFQVQSDNWTSNKLHSEFMTRNWTLRAYCFFVASRARAIPILHALAIMADRKHRPQQWSAMVANNFVRYEFIVFGYRATFRLHRLYFASNLEYQSLRCRLIITNESDEHKLEAIDGERWSIHRGSNRIESTSVSSPKRGIFFRSLSIGVQNHIRSSNFRGGFPSNARETSADARAPLGFPAMKIPRVFD